MVPEMGIFSGNAALPAYMRRATGYNNISLFIRLILRIL